LGDIDLITTIFDSDFPITGSLSIIKEWIIDYLLTDIYDISDETPQFDENYIMTKPMIYLQFMSGQVRNVGIGKVINQTQKAQFENIDVMCWIYVDNNVGGLTRCREIADILKTVIRKNGYLLNQAGLTNPRMGYFREFPKSSYSPVFGGRMLMSFRVLCSYNG